MQNKPEGKAAMTESVFRKKPRFKQNSFSQPETQPSIISTGSSSAQPWATRKPSKWDDMQVSSLMLRNKVHTPFTSIHDHQPTLCTDSQQAETSTKGSTQLRRIGKYEELMGTKTKKPQPRLI
jgi:hypothetical protein